MTACSTVANANRGASLAQILLSISAVITKSLLGSGPRLDFEQLKKVQRKENLAT